jgi:hypothetical protein
MCAKTVYENNLHCYKLNSYKMWHIVVLLLCILFVGIVVTAIRVYLEIRRVQKSFALVQKAVNLPDQYERPEVDKKMTKESTEVLHHYQLLCMYLKNSTLQMCHMTWMRSSSAVVLVD